MTTQQDAKAILDRVYTQDPRPQPRHDFDVVTVDEAVALWADPIMSDPRWKLLVGIERQVIHGDRCAVCGMTTGQAEEAGYDCVKEC